MEATASCGCGVQRVFSPALVEQRSMNFLGVDVGFATSSLTTGLAWRIGDEVGATKTGTSWKRRREVLPSGITYSIAALDAPILPEHEEQSHRGCESIFYGGAFWNRCRPGLSHHGRALGLRRAGADAASQFATVVSGLDLVSELQVRRNCAIVEAFPNTFLGVLLPEAIYEDRDFGFSERKSDWMYRKVAERGIFRKLLIQLRWTEPGTITQFHDQAGLDGNSPCSARHLSVCSQLDSLLRATQWLLVTRRTDGSGYHLRGFGKSGLGLPYVSNFTNSRAENFRWSMFGKVSFSLRQHAVHSLKRRSQADDSATKTCYKRRQGDPNNP